jgi:hypothetical protein
VAILHHHPTAFSEPTPVDDFSTLQNNDKLLEILNEFRFDLIIHGHKHFPRASEELRDGDHPIFTLCSGSFSALMPSEWNGSVLNHFHVVRVDSRDPESGVVQGVVDSFAYKLPEGWIPSRREYGFEPHWGFGRILMWPFLEGRLSSVLSGISPANPVLGSDDVVRAIPELKNVAPKILRRALERVCSEAGLRVEPSETPGRFMVVFR